MSDHIPAFSCLGEKRTDEVFENLSHSCRGCSRPLVFLVNPEYDIELDVSIPLELCFTWERAELHLMEHTPEWLSEMPKAEDRATGMAFKMVCPECACPNFIPVSDDGGVIVDIPELEPCTTALPVSRLRWFSERREWWS